MNYEMVKGLVERLAAFVALYLVSKGYLPESAQSNIVELLALGALAVLGIFFGITQNTQATLIKAAASMPDVKKVVVSDAVDASKLTAPNASVTKS